MIAGQVTAEARDELAVLAGAEVLALTDRVWQSGEAFARAALARGGGRARRRAPTLAASRADAAPTVRPRARGRTWRGRPGR